MTDLGECRKQREKGAHHKEKRVELNIRATSVVRLDVHKTIG
jgi:hypothetical protein